MRKTFVTLGLACAGLFAPWSSGTALAQTIAALPSAGAAADAASARVIVKYKGDPATTRGYYDICRQDFNPTKPLLQR